MKLFQFTVITFFLPAILFGLFYFAYLGPSTSAWKQYPGKDLIVHVLSSLTAFSYFTIAAILACVYLPIYIRNEKRFLGSHKNLLSSLPIIEKYMTTCVVAGLLLMSISAITGWFWVWDSLDTQFNPNKWINFIILLLYLVSLLGKLFFNFNRLRFAFTIILCFSYLLWTQLLNVHS
ncbi:MAG: cytochrome c biogenesis protein CcsA [Fibrobacteria bacterium]|nr:cytochrome c biogenesis protein CcsA [Fibrobacteria bacterium]